MRSNGGPDNASAPSLEKHWRRVCLLAVAVLLALPAAAGAGGAGVGQLVVHEEPIPVPPLHFTDHTNTPHNLDEHKGQVVVLNIWATWCPPCLQEMPALDALQAEMGERGVQVLPLVVDRIGGRAASRVFAKRNIMSLPVLAAKGVDVVRALREEALPLTVLIDRNGQEVARVRGAAEWNRGEFRTLVERLAAQ